jgi:hypothetical protein
MMVFAQALLEITHRVALSHTAATSLLGLAFAPDYVTSITAQSCEKTGISKLDYAAVARSLYARYVGAN